MPAADQTRVGGIACTVLGLSVMLSAASGAAASCGMVIGPGASPGSFSAPQNCAGTALTIVGPVEVDLRGQTVTCESNDHPNAGILILGEGARVKNGKVANCEIGVGVGGTGNHRLLRLEARHNGEAVKESGGFIVVSDNNQLWQVVARENGQFGVRVDGDRNFVRHSDISANAGAGVIIFGAHNTLARSTVNANEEPNIVVSHAQGGRTTIELGGDHNRILDNEANASTGHDGLYISGDGNIVRGNETSGNFRAGIRVTDEGQENRVLGNKAHDNHKAQTSAGVELTSFDLQDANLNCDDNLWRDNNFGNSRMTGAGNVVENPECIR